MSFLITLSVNLDSRTSSTRKILDAIIKLYDRIVDPNLLVRRMYVVANHVQTAAGNGQAQKEPQYEQLELFTDYDARDKERQKEKELLEKEHRLQQAVLDIKSRYGKNAILKGMNLEEKATAIERNRQVGGHKE